MKRKIQFGIVGCGRIGSRHAKFISKNRRAKLVAVCDINKSKSNKIAKEYGCKALYDYNELLNEDIDVINVCTPSGMHADMAVKALGKSRHVLCEKPMTVNLADADRVLKAEEKSKKKFFLVKQNRYNPPVKVLKDAVYNKKLGKLTLINCNVIWNRHKAYYTEDEWKGTMKLDGGALMTQCSHFLDLMVWIGGGIKSVYANMANLSHPYIETEDTGFVTLVFENGAIGSLQYTTTAYRKNREGSMTVIGTKGAIKVGGEYINTLDYWDVEGVEKPKVPKGGKANDYGTYKGSMSNHDKVIENVIDVLLGDGEIATNSTQGRYSIEVMQAAYISAYTGKKVDLPLRNGNYKFKLDKQKPLSGNVKHI